ncbi:MAG: hypothetical protein KKE30_03320 [Gammaproteobacteria bacterium]|nr:hypothetical protein [Gammaproteobacteria bacterium]MBU1555537.1 hypothetical protein [Gammaproteobacteria bacterium]MBU2071321.1 hypothetical protein [Gammaproteobacteria bacterium]MBU2182493.1 hypothetical protein [Gammaproteobacteria bacterium]MBU2204653.1 hypothetical protein [Gammaproteobacteria bacterium]
MPKSNSGRPLPPLLPLEYCTIERAAKLLQCEPDDLMHWAEIAAIKLWLKPDNENCGVLFLLEHDFKRLQKLTLEQNSEDIFDTVLICVGASTFSLSTEDLTDQDFPDCEPLTFEVIEVGGLWAVEFSDITRHSNKDEGYFTPHVLYSDMVENSYFILDLDADMRFKLNELLITRSDLEKLHFAITTGEPLKSRFNDSNLASEVNDREKHRHRPIENNSPKKALALLSLSECVIRQANLDKELINRPDALTTAINKELLKLGIPEIDGPKTLYSAFQVAIQHRKKM